MTLNRYDGDVPDGKAIIQAGQLTGGIHYHYDTQRPVVPKLLPPLSRRSRAAALGASEEYQGLTALVDNGAKLVVLTGPAGVGKTAVTLKWAHAHLDQWPDGQLHADLAPDEEGNPVAISKTLARWLGAFGVADDDIPESLAELTNEWRTRTFDKYILLFLDDAVSAAQVRCLLPNSTNAVTVVTSRMHLSMLVLNGARFLPVGPRRHDSTSDFWPNGQM